VKTVRPVADVENLRTAPAFRVMPPIVSDPGPAAPELSRLMPELPRSRLIGPTASVPPSSLSVPPASVTGTASPPRTDVGAHATTAA
jgi:hypothetical protein